MQQEGSAERILQVMGRMDRGGAETLVMNLFRNIDREKLVFDFVIHTEDECEYCDEIRALGGRVHKLGRIQDMGPLAYKGQWRQFFKDHPEYRIVHGHMRSTASIYLKEAKRAGRVAIAHSHNTSSGAGIEALVKSALQLPLRYCADWYIGCSIPSAQWLFGKNVIKRSNFSLIRNVVDTKRFQYNEEERSLIRHQLGVEGDEPVILFIGRLEPQKNLPFLKKIFEEVVRINSKARLYLCGLGPEDIELENWIKDKSLEGNACYLGSRSDIPRLMWGADVFLMPSLFEGLPVTLIECQASGLKACVSDVITDEAILTDLVDKVSLGETPALWAQRCLELAAMRPERKEYAARVLQAGYDVNNEAKKLTSFYFGLLKKQ